MGVEIRFLNSSIMREKLREAWIRCRFKNIISSGSKRTLNKLPQQADRCSYCLTYHLPWRWRQCFSLKRRWAFTSLAASHRRICILRRENVNSNRDVDCAERGVDELSVSLENVQSVASQRPIDTSPGKKTLHNIEVEGKYLPAARTND